MDRIRNDYSSNFGEARSRLYQRRFLQRSTHFAAFFRDLQELQTFAPLEIQNFRQKSSTIFANFIWTKIEIFNFLISQLE